ncbi:MAG: hypothetical protein H6Q60_887 [Oscillospiraceae bacterium]|nr:hypothetical protein [Oscillospiraceae bacterium]
MDLTRGHIVYSSAGHDKGLLFYVLDTDGAFLLLADGKHRKTARPKRKKAMHVVHAGTFQHPVTARVCAGEPVADSEIRKALAAFRGELESRRV